MVRDPSGVLGALVGRALVVRDRRLAVGRGCRTLRGTMLMTRAIALLEVSVVTSRREDWVITYVQAP